MRVGRSNRGFYFVSILLVSVVVALMLGAGLVVAQKDLGATAHLADRENALKAAESGLRYAQSRLAENYTWRGDANAVVVDTPDLFVREDNGNVIGLLRFSGGEFAQFRLRFNFQDDSDASREMLSDPSVEMWINNDLVSLNNLRGSSPLDVLVGDGTAGSVTADSAVRYQVPGGAVAVLVEGRAGPGLRDVARTNLDPSSPLGSKVSVRTVEAILRPTGSGSDPSVHLAAGMAADDLIIDLGADPLTVQDLAPGGVPRLRSKAEISVAGGPSGNNFIADEGETYSASGSIDARFDSGSVDNLVEEEDHDFYRLEWDDVKKADPSGPSLNSGTYVLWDDGTLHYYDMDFDRYVQHITANPADEGIVNPTLPDTMTLDLSDSSNPKLTITGDTAIQATGASEEFNLIPRKGASEDPPTKDYEAEDDSTIDAFVASLPPPTVPGEYQHTFPVPESFSDTGTFNWPDSNVEFEVVDNGDGTATAYCRGAGVPSTATEWSTWKTYFAYGLKELAPLQPLAKIVLGQRMEELPTSDTLQADNIEVNFQPSGESAVLSTDSDIRIAARVTGEGGSITAGGGIRLVGTGSNLASAPEDGVNLYARGDITLSSLKSESGTYSFKDCDMKGVIYTWGDFEGKIGFEGSSRGKFQLQGALVAYGGNPANAPGSGEGGSIHIVAEGVDLIFDPAYLVTMAEVPPPGPLRQTFYVAR